MWSQPGTLERREFMENTHKLKNNQVSLIRSHGYTNSTDANESMAWASDWTGVQSFHQKDDSWAAFKQEDDGKGAESEIVPSGQWWSPTAVGSSCLTLSSLHNVSRVFVEAFPSVDSTCGEPDCVPTLKELLQGPAENHRSTKPQYVPLRSLYPPGFLALALELHHVAKSIGLSTPYTCRSLCLCGNACPGELWGTLVPITNPVQKTLPCPMGSGTCNTGLLSPSCGDMNQSLLDGLQDLDRMIDVKYKRAESLSRKLLLQSLHLGVVSSERPGRKQATARFSPNLPTSNQQLAANAKRRLSYDINRNVTT
ncbi:hypothetical protein NFI96_007972 [Prochilodus magdalenae]|nr:hypothetical protein NFI96_007972 [Prochilodus magdalenae]